MTKGEAFGLLTGSLEQVVNVGALMLSFGTNAVVTTIGKVKGIDFGWAQAMLLVMTKPTVSLSLIGLYT